MVLYTLSHRQYFISRCYATHFHIISNTHIIIVIWIQILKQQAWYIQWLGILLFQVKDRGISKAGRETKSLGENLLSVRGFLALERLRSHYPRSPCTPWSEFVKAEVCLRSSYQILINKGFIRNDLDILTVLSFFLKFEIFSIL